MTTINELKPTARRVMRRRETTQTAGACDMTLRRWEMAGKFPRRFKLAPDSGPFGAVGWDFDEVQEHLEKRRASRDSATEGDDPGGAAGDGGS